MGNILPNDMPDQRGKYPRYSISVICLSTENYNPRGNVCHYFPYVFPKLFDVIIVSIIYLILSCKELTKLNSKEQEPQ